MKCSDEQCFNFFHELLNSHVENEAERRYGRSLSSAIRAYDYLFNELGFFTEHFTDESYHEDEWYARIWKIDKSYHFYAKIDRRVYDVKRDEFPFAKI